MAATAQTSAHLKLLDCDALSQKIQECQKAHKELEGRLADVEARMEKCLALLQSRTESDILSLLDKSEDADLKIRYTLEETHELCRWEELSYRVTANKLLGLEVLSLAKNNCLFIIHCYEKHYPSLPPKIFKIENIPNSNNYKMRPKEISYYMGCDESLRNRMIKSAESEMVNCFREMQSLIFDLVYRDNIYQNLRAMASIAQGLSCQRSRDNISIVLPMKPLSETGQEVLPSSSHRVVSSLLSNCLTVTLMSPGPDTNYRWTAEVHSHKQDAIQVPSQTNSNIRAFFKNLTQMSVVESVKALIKEFNLDRYSRAFNLSDSEMSDDEFHQSF